VTRRWIVQGLATGLGLLLLVFAWRANPAWFDRHFLPVFFVPYRLYRLGETGARFAAGLIGLGLIAGAAPALGRWTQRSSGKGMAADMARLLVALILAAGLCEAGLRLVFPRPTEAPQPGVEPLRRADPRLGWTFVPDRVAHQTIRGRTVTYAFDANGLRVARLDQPADFGRPSILFSGESIVTGAGLDWDQTFAAETAAALGLQPANLSVFAYSDDQAFLRLTDLLPRFAEPRAVVILVSPGLMFRDLDDERPHLGPRLDWRAAEHGSRLLALVRLFVPYHSAGAVAAMKARVRAELTETVRQVRARGGEPLILVPRFGPEDPREAALRRAVLDGLPTLPVELDPSWRQPHDPHPDARGARAIADALVARLKTVSPGESGSSARAARDPWPPN
jgi:hypothetical protein